MKNVFVLFWSIGLIFSLTRCETIDSENYSIQNQEIYFQYEYTNYAWGKSHSGWYIDSTGSVLCFNLPDDWNYPDSTGIITQQQIQNNLTKINSVCLNINKSNLIEKIQLIPDAAQGKISEPEHQMYDAGVGVFSTFIYSDKTKTYKQIVLKQSGDFFVDNSAPEAEILYNWMVSVNKEINDLKN